MSIAKATKAQLIERDLPTGTTLENRVTWRLHRWGVLDKTQHRVGKYRLDYAWPAVLIALEVDGPFHRQPECAARDAVRDAWLRSKGWLVFRIDDEANNLDEQLCRVARMIRAETNERNRP